MCERERVAWNLKMKSPRCANCIDFMKKKKTDTKKDDDHDDSSDSAKDDDDSMLVPSRQGNTKLESMSLWPQKREKNKVEVHLEVMTLETTCNQLHSCWNKEA